MSQTALLPPPCALVGGVVACVAVAILLLGVCGLASCSKSSGPELENSACAGQPLRHERKPVTFVIIESDADLVSISAQVVTLFLRVVDQAILAAIAERPWIKEIHVRDSSDTTAEDIKSLGGALELTELHLHNGGAKPETFWQQLSELRHLRRLTLAEFDAVSTHKLLLLTRLRFLGIVDLTRCTFSSTDAVDAFASWPALDRLTLNSVTGLDNQSLRLLPPLGYLSLRDNLWLHDAGVEHLKRQQAAWAIDVTGCRNVSSGALARLAESLPECSVRTSDR